MSKETPKRDDDICELKRMFIGMTAAVYVAHIAAENASQSKCETKASLKYLDQPLVHYWTAEQHVVFEQVLMTILMFVMVSMALRGALALLRFLISISPLPKFINRACETAKRSARQFLSFLAK